MSMYMARAYVDKCIYIHMYVITFVRHNARSPSIPENLSKAPYPSIYLFIHIYTYMTTHAYMSISVSIHTYIHTQGHMHLFINVYIPVPSHNVRRPSIPANSPNSHIYRFLGVSIYIHTYTY